MIFKEYINEQDFLEENESILFHKEDINHTLLGIIPQTEKEKIFFRIEDDGKVYLIGLITKTERKGLIIYFEDYARINESCGLLIDEIIKRDVDLREIKAPKGIAEMLFSFYSQKKDVEMKVSKNKYLMKLNKCNLGTF